MQDWQPVSRRNVLIANLVIFMIFGYLGAVVENLAYYIGKTKKYSTNIIASGFPFFSIGAFTLVGVGRLLPTTNPLVQFLVFGSVATLMELSVGLLIGAGPNSRYADGTVKKWDYTGEAFNYKGIISLRHFIVWGGLGLVAIRLYDYLTPRIAYGLQSVEDHSRQQKTSSKQ